MRSPSITRRAALQGLALASAFGGVRLAGASPATVAVDDEPRLLLVFLRGGLDALAAVPPFGDPYYAAARGPLVSLGIAEMHKLDGLFALHPGLSPLLPYFVAGELLIVPATAIPSVDRSHAAAQSALFDGDIDADNAGWLGRAASALSHQGSGIWRAAPGDRSIDMLADLALGNPLLDIGSLSGEHGWLPGPLCTDSVLARRSACEAAHFAEAARNAARVLSNLGGPRIAMLELAGFDTHVAQGEESGRLARSLQALAGGLVSFAEASGSAWRRTVVMVVTEFGRSVSPNSDGGTDHGTASVTFLMGGAVAGGRVGDAGPGLPRSTSWRN